MAGKKTLRHSQGAAAPLVVYNAALPPLLVLCRLLLEDLWGAAKDCSLQNGM